MRLFETADQADGVGRRLHCMRGRLNCASRFDYCPVGGALKGVLMTVKPPCTSLRSGQALVQMLLKSV